MGVQPSFWRSSGKTDAAFLYVVNRAFHTNLPTALSAQTWLTSMGYYSNWVEEWISMEISGGLLMSQFIKNGQVWSWGNNNFGQLGDNTIISRCAPTSIQGSKKTFCKINSGRHHTIGIDYNGQVWGWGYNNKGQLGDNSITCRCTPVSIQGAKKTFCKINSGYFDTVAIDKHGQVWGWGFNGYGQLGDNSVISPNTPVSIQGAKKTFCDISGYKHTMGLDKYGQVWGWGYNSFGVLGDNSVVSKCTPVSIQGAKKTFCQIAGGDTHTIGIDKYSQVWCWGINTTGQLGDNSTDSRRTPVSIRGAKKTFCKISVGQSFSIGLDKYGQAWGWGYNGYGQLGDNSTTLRCTPVSIRGARKTFCKIKSGDSHTLAIDKNGQLWSWGYNNKGQLGDNTILIKLTPVRVCNF